VDGNVPTRSIVIGKILETVDLRKKKMKTCKNWNPNCSYTVKSDNLGTVLNCKYEEYCYFQDPRDESKNPLRELDQK